MVGLTHQPSGERLLARRWFLVQGLATGAVFAPQIARSAAAAPAWPERLAYKREELFSISLSRFGTPLVSALINRQAILLTFDTGNMSGLAITRESARRLGLPVVDETNIYDSSGEPMGKRAVFRADSLAAFGDHWKGQPAVEVEDNIGASGLLGPKYLRDRRCTLDYQGRWVAVAKTPAPASIAGEWHPLFSSDHFPGMPVIRASIHGIPVLVQLDTGKSRTCIAKRLAEKLRLARNERGYRIDQIRLGSLSFSVPSAKEVDFEGFAAAYPEPVDLGIGSDVLSKVLFTVDYLAGVLVVHPAG